MPETNVSPLVPREGWHVMHLFYQIDHSQWSILGDDEKRAAKYRGRYHDDVLMAKMLATRSEPNPNAPGGESRR